MSALSDYAGRVTAYSNRVSTAVDGITADLQALKDLITQIQNNPGPISAEDQAALDQAEALLASVAGKAEALDAVNPPPAPPNP